MVAGLCIFLLRLALWYYAFVAELYVAGSENPEIVFCCHAEGVLHLVIQHLRGFHREIPGIHAQPSCKVCNTKRLSTGYQGCKSGFIPACQGTAALFGGKFCREYHPGLSIPLGHFVLQLPAAFQCIYCQVNIYVLQFPFSQGETCGVRFRMFADEAYRIFQNFW